jgi:hypothetical protein
MKETLSGSTTPGVNAGSVFSGQFGNPAQSRDDPTKRRRG